MGSLFSRGQAKQIVAETESLPMLQKRAEAMRVKINNADSLKRLVNNPDWKYFDNLLAHLKGEITQEGQITNDIQKRSGCFEQLTAIGKINIALNNAINLGEETLRQYDELNDRIEKLSKQSA